MGTAVELVVAEPPRPRLDRGAVEAARLIRVARDRLITDAEAVTVAMLAEGRGTSTNTARQWLNRHRKNATLITVDHNGGVLIPTFQLDEAFDVHPVCGPVIAQLAVGGLNGWAIWHWFYAHNGWVDARPVDLVVTGDTDTLARAVRGLLSAA